MFCKTGAPQGYICWRGRIFVLEVQREMLNFCLPIWNLPQKKKEKNVKRRLFFRPLVFGQPLPYSTKYGFRLVSRRLEDFCYLFDFGSERRFETGIAEGLPDHCKRSSLSSPLAPISKVSKWE